MKKSILFAALLVAATSARSQVYITEFMYGGNDDYSIHEIIEITNFGPVAVDISGWRLWTEDSFTGTLLENFAPIAPGESVIVNYESDALFRGVWPGVGTNVQIEQGPTLGRGDFIRIYDENNALVDELEFDDRIAPGGPRALGVSAVTTFMNLGENNFAGWFLSTSIDTPGFENLTSIHGDIGNPGYLNFAYTPVPEPASAAALLGLLALGAASLRRRR